MSEQQNELPGLPPGLSSGWAGPEDELDVSRIWLRWDAREMCFVRILSAAPLFYPGHWFPASRSFRLCTYPSCQFCALAGSPSGETRRRAGERQIRHLVAVELDPGEQRIWEFGPAVARQLQALTGYKRDGGVVTRTAELRGLAVRLVREGGSPQRAVQVTTAPAEMRWPEYLPEPMDLAGTLALSWQRAARRDGKGNIRLPVGF